MVSLVFLLVFAALGVGYACFKQRKEKEKEPKGSLGHEQTSIDYNGVFKSNLNRAAESKLKSRPSEDTNVKMSSSENF